MIDIIAFTITSLPTYATASTWYYCDGKHHLLPLWWQRVRVGNEWHRRVYAMYKPAERFMQTPCQCWLSSTHRRLVQKIIYAHDVQATASTSYHCCDGGAYVAAPSDVTYATASTSYHRCDGGAYVAALGATTYAPPSQFNSRSKVKMDNKSDWSSLMLLFILFSKKKWGFYKMRLITAKFKHTIAIYAKITRFTREYYAGIYAIA